MSNDGGPAFPIKDMNEHFGPLGMSLRDYFAAAAMQTFCDSDNSPWVNREDKEKGVTWEDKVSEAAYELADAMLKARGK